MHQRVCFILAVLFWALVAAGCSRQPQWNVLLVTFDTTRADHLGCYGHPTISTPTVDRLAREGIRFERAYATVPLTLPSHSSLLTGNFPTVHGVRDNGLFKLGNEHVTLAELLAEHGYRTAAAVGAFPLLARFGLDQGFELYDDDLERYREDALGRRSRKRQLYFEERPAGWVNEAVFGWLEQDLGRPFFLWVHYYDPHQPFDPPPPYDQLYANDLYAGEIAYADESLGVLLDRLHQLGEADRTLVVFTSDHGEGLDDHGEETHGYLLYDSTLRVPLILRPPDGASGKVVRERVRLVDVLPTVLELLGLPRPAELDGRSLLGLFGDSPERAPRPHYAETLSPRLGQGWGELRALYDGPFKYIHGPRPELFDLEADPNELNDLSERQPDLAASMRLRLADFLARQRSGAAAALPPDDETRQRLMALGYLQGSSVAAAQIREQLLDGGVAPQDRVGDIARIATVRHLLHAGQALVARDEVRVLLEADPENPFYRELLATAELDLGRLDEALPILDQLVEEGTRQGSAEGLLIEVGQQLHDAGRSADGVAAVRRSLAVVESASGLLLLARLLAEQGDDVPGTDRQATELLRRAVQIDPELVDARLDLAVHLAASGDNAAAGDEFRHVLNQQPYSARAHYNFGAFLLRQGLLDDADRHIRRAIDLQADYSQARHALVALLLARGLRQEAERSLADWQQVLPGDPVLVRARTLLEEG